MATYITDVLKGIVPTQGGESIPSLYMRAMSHPKVKGLAFRLATSTGSEPGQSTSGGNPNLEYSQNPSPIIFLSDSDSDSPPHSYTISSKSPFLR